MAKKKEFDNIVDESFKEGYEREPELVKTEQIPEIKQEEPVVEERLSEKELLLRKIIAGDEEVLREILGKEDRSTYYITDVHRACIDIMSHEEGVKKGQIVVDALNAYFSNEIKEAAKERVVTMAIKKLEREIKKENK